MKQKMSPITNRGRQFCKRITYKTMNSTFRNWHTSLTNSRKKELSRSFPVSVTGTPDRIQITIQNDDEKRITIEFSKEDSALFLMQVDRVLNPEKYKRKNNE